MGYNTAFDGEWKLNKPLDGETKTFLIKLANTRRMKRTGLDEKYGIEGEFFVDASGFMGQDSDDSVVDYNQPPSTQPSLWCKWIPNDEGTAIEWDGGEKFYDYIPWIEYLIENILAPRGYVLNGDIKWEGEDSDDFGIIRIEDNVVKCAQGTKGYMPFN